MPCHMSTLHPWSQRKRQRIPKYKKSPDPFVTRLKGSSTTRPNNLDDKISRLIDPETAAFRPHDKHQPATTTQEKRDNTQASRQEALARWIQTASLERQGRPHSSLLSQTQLSRQSVSQDRTSLEDHKVWWATVMPQVATYTPPRYKTQPLERQTGGNRGERRRLTNL